VSVQATISDVSRSEGWSLRHAILAADLRGSIRVNADMETNGRLIVITSEAQKARIDRSQLQAAGAAFG
jgi:hypothetical protein